MTRELVIVAKCDFCGAGGQTESMDFTVGNQAYELDWCAKHDHLAKALAAARKVKKTSTEEHSCEECGKTFKTARGLTKHQTQAHSTS